MLGVIDDVTRRTPIGFAAEGQQIYLLGTTRDELDGSEWAHVVHGHLGGLPPAVDLAAERELADILVNASRDGLVDAAHDLSDGGLAQALVESCLRHGVGARVWLPGGRSTRSSRCSPSRRRGRSWPCRAARRCGSPTCAPRVASRMQRIGVTDGRGDAAVLEVQEQFVLPLAELRAAWTSTLPTAFA